MKKIYSFLMIICITLIAHDKSPDQRTQLWQRAHFLYKKGAVADALAVYEMINPKVPAVWFNMGNCYCILKKRSQALLCWNRARRGASATQLKRIDEAIAALSPHHPVSLFEQISLLYTRCFAPFSPLSLQLILLFAWYTFMVVGWIIPHKKRTRVLRIVCGTIIIFSMSGLWLQLSRSGPQVMIMNDDTPVYGGPYQDYHTVGTLNVGMLVGVKEEKKGWYKIKSHKKNGWVRTQDVCMV